MLDNPWKKLEEAHGIHTDWQQQDTAATTNNDAPVPDCDQEQQEEDSTSMMGKMSDEGIHDRTWH